MASLLRSIETVSINSLTLHPQNARRGNVEVIAESLDANAQFTPIIVQRSTGYVLAGNHTVRAARELGWTEIDVAFVDVDDDRALRIMLAANRTADLATNDDEALAALLEALDGDFMGSGYNADDLDDLLAELDRLPETPLTASGATWTETADELEARAERLGGWGSRESAGIRETVIVLPQEDHEELHTHLTTCRSLMQNNDLTNGEVVLHAMRKLAASLA